MSSYLNLNGINDIFEATLNNELQDNIVEFFDWGLLEKGNYFNVTLGELDENGQDMSLLRISSNPHFPSGKAWEGFRKNWVWQSGISHSPSPLVGTNPAIPGISGVYVNNTFYPSDTTGEYAHKVDYFNGRIVFDNPIPTGSKVQAEHSYKYINVIYANNVPWLREVQYKTFNKDNSFISIDRGEFNIPAEIRVQLPAIAVEVVPRRTMRGFQLGGGQWIYTDVIFHCISEDEMTRNKLLDIISYQNDRVIYMFNSNEIAKSGAFPIDYSGTPVSGALRYPDLINSYKSNALCIKNCTIQNMDLINSNFYAGIIRCTTEVVKENI